jgi:hypothetical protein
MYTGLYVSGMDCAAFNSARRLCCADWGHLVPLFFYEHYGTSVLEAVDTAACLIKLGEGLELGQLGDDDQYRWSAHYLSSASLAETCTNCLPQCRCSCC